MSDGASQTNQTPKVQTSPPWGMIVVLVAILAVSVGAIWVLIAYKDVFQNSTDVTTLLGNWFTVVGTLVGAYFGVKASSDATDKTQGAIQTANDTANRALGALNPADAGNIVGQPPTQ
jgi:hypothetical protein